MGFAVFMDVIGLIGLGSHEETCFEVFEGGELFTEFLHLCF
jgi:hypothetical protein